MSEYVWIRHWAEHLGLDDDLIDARQRLAEMEGAPLDAMFRRHGSDEWVTLGEKMDNPITLEWARQYV